MREIGVLILLVVFVIIIAIVGYALSAYSPEKKKFLRQMQERTEKTQAINETCTSDEINKLPKPLQKYCEYAGLKDFPKYQVVNIFFKDTDFVFDTKSEKVLRMDYDLWLYTEPIFRTAFCSSSMYGIPFEGVDYMIPEEREGGMCGVLAKHINIFDIHDASVYRAGIISWLAESAAINPAVLLSPYISYEEIDDLHVKATVSYNGVTGSGIFSFNELGQITEFFSAERQVEEIDGVRMELGWKCYYEQYEEIDGMKRITKTTCTKIFPDGRELKYFTGDDIKVNYMK